MDKGKWEMAWRRQHQTQLTAQHMPYTHAPHRTCTSPHPLIKYDNSPQPPSRETFAPLSPLFLTSFSSLLDSLFLLQTLGPSPLDAANSLCLSCPFELLILGHGQRRVPFTRIPPPPRLHRLRKMSQKMLRRRQKKKSFEEQNVNGTNNRFLISVNVLGSAGPIRFVVNEGDLIAAVIDTALKSYARQGRLPHLGSDINQFLLPWELIGSCGGRNFVLCKKQIEPQMRETRPEMLGRKGSGSWKTWLNKSFNFKILSH
ncbi:hypothetical protein AAG906_038386 [Vitis piasezkii]